MTSRCNLPRRFASRLSHFHPDGRHTTEHSLSYAPFDVGYLLATLLLSTRCDELSRWPTTGRSGAGRIATACGARRASSRSSPATQLKIRWRAPIGSGYSGPTVADGRVYRHRSRWSSRSRSNACTASTAKTGKPLWTHSYDCAYENVGYTAGPRASVTDRRRPRLLAGHDGPPALLRRRHAARCCGARICNAEYKIRMPIWGIAASPLVDGDLVIVQIGGEGACLVAFDKQTGAEKWRALDDHASYSAPIIIEQAGRRVLVCWTGDSVVGLERRRRARSIGSIPSSRPRW